MAGQLLCSMTFKGTTTPEEPLPTQKRGRAGLGSPPRRVSSGPQGHTGCEDPVGTKLEPGSHAPPAGPQAPGIYS